MTIGKFLFFVDLIAANLFGKLIWVKLVDSIELFSWLLVFVFVSIENNNQTKRSENRTKVF